MKDRLRRSFVFSTTVHAVVLLLIVVVPAITRLIHRPRPKDIMMVDLLNALPALPVPAPQEAVTETKTTPEPAPKEKIPEIAEKPKIKINTNRVKRATVQQAPPSKKPPLTAAEIRKLLSAGIPQGGSGGGGGGGEADAMTWYYALVRATMYEAWEPPSAATTMGLQVQVMIRVQRDGTITERTLRRGSGNDQMDASAMRAVQSVTRLKPLPPEVPGSSLDITITFAPMTGNAL
jgi:TonB family protein